MYSPNGVVTERDGNEDREGQAAGHPYQRLIECLSGGRCMCIPMPVEVDRQQNHDQNKQNDPRPDGDVEIDETRTVAFGRCQYQLSILSTITRRTVEGLAPTGRVGRGTGQHTAGMTADPGGYSPSTAIFCPKHQPPAIPICAGFRRVIRRSGAVLRRRDRRRPRRSPSPKRRSASAAFRSRWCR